MRPPFLKGVIISSILLVLVGSFLIYSFYYKAKPVPEVVKEEVVGPVHKVIGTSVEGRQIDSYTYGTGSKNITFVGGIHGGYEWNSVLLAYKFIDYLDANPTAVPADLSVTVIPSANPDGLYKVIGKEGRFTSADIPVDKSTEPGRFNAHEVDLNRNFDCKWQPTSAWKSKIVSGGTKAFSEPESMAIKNFVSDTKPVAMIFWHSQSGHVYASQCEHGVLPETVNIMNVYATAAGYPAVKTFDAYTTSGDSEGWLASIGIPALTVELTTHETIEWEKNLKGIMAILQYYSN